MKKIPGNPSHKFWIEIEAFFYLTFSYLYYGDYSSFLLSQGRPPFKKYMIRYPKDYKSSLLEVPFNKIRNYFFQYANGYF